jgi:hypothetical protein
MAYSGKQEPREGDRCILDGGMAVTVTGVCSRPTGMEYASVFYRLDDGREGQLFYSEFWWGATPVEVV